MELVQEPVDATTEGPDESEATPRPRPAWARWVDPWDVAGRATHAVLPKAPTPALAHGMYFLVLGGFIAIEVLEAPVAILLGAGHLMLASHNRFLHEMGAAFEEAA